MSDVPAPDTRKRIGKKEAVQRTALTEPTGRVVGCDETWCFSAQAVVETIQKFQHTNHVLGVETAPMLLHHHEAGTPCDGEYHELLEWV